MFTENEVAQCRGLTPWARGKFSQKTIFSRLNNSSKSVEFRFWWDQPLLPFIDFITDCTAHEHTVNLPVL